MCSFTSLAQTFLCAKYVPRHNESVYIERLQPPQSRLCTPTCLHGCRFIGSDEAIQSRARDQNNYPSFGIKSTLSCIPTEQATLVPES